MRESKGDEESVRVCEGGGGEGVRVLWERCEDGGQMG